MAEAGAGRGLTVPPTAAEMRRIEKRADRNVFTVEKLNETKTPKGEKLPRDLMPSDPPPVKKAAGGSASSRADGCAQRGKTRGMIV
jgi:hypothetical protein